MTTEVVPAVGSNGPHLWSQHSGSRGPGVNRLGANLGYIMCLCLLKNKDPVNLTSNEQIGRAF